MIAKKASPFLTRRPPKRELAYLYDRRVAIDALIQALEQYDRSRAKTAEMRPRKTA
jgi:hypothetical protein